LFESLCNQSDFIPINAIISFLLELVYPFSINQVVTFGCRNQVPSFVLVESMQLFFHCLLPLAITKCFLKIFWFSCRAEVPQRTVPLVNLLGLTMPLCDLVLPRTRTGEAGASKSGEELKVVAAEDPVGEVGTGDPNGKGDSAPVPTGP
jgi:hypothetical protein